MGLYKIIKSLNYFILNRITFIFPSRKGGEFKDFKGKWLVISSILFAILRSDLFKWVSVLWL